MPRSQAPFLVLVCAATLLLALPLAAQYSQRIEVAVANLDVVVTDRSGKPVKGLTKDDFEVYENGRLQTITHFSVIEGYAEGPAAASEAAEAAPPAASQPPASRPRLIILYLDVVDMDRSGRHQFFNGLAQFLGSVFREGDFVTVFNWTHRVKPLLPPSSSRAQVEALMKALSTGSGARQSELAQLIAETRVLATERDREFSASMGLAFASDPQAEAEFEQFAINEERCSAIKRKAKELRNLITSFARVDMQKVLVIANDDLSLRPHGGCTTRPELERLADTANAYGITIHALHPPGARKFAPPDRGSFMPRSDPTMAAEYGRAADQSDGLRFLGDRTGGVTALGPVQSVRMLEQAAAELDHYYSLGYSLSPDNEDIARQVKVTTKNRSYRVRARQTVMRLSEKRRLHDRVMTNLYLPQRDEVQSPPFAAKIEKVTRDGRALLAHVAVTVRTSDLHVVSTEDKKRRGSFSVFVAAGRELGDASDVNEMKQDFEIPAHVEGEWPIVYTFAVRVRPDTRRLSIALRDNATGEVATKLLVMVESPR